MKANEFITERFFNAFSTEDKTKYAQDIYDMLQRSYKPIGGIAGKGFSSVEDMINSNYMFKVGLDNDKPVMVAVYADKGNGGRKKVALGTDGSKRGKEMAKNSLRAEFLTKRSFGEISGPAFASVKKQIPPEILTMLLIPPSKVSALIGKEVSIGPGDDLLTDESDPYYRFYYHREIGGEIHTKVAYGDPTGASRFY